MTVRPPAPGAQHHNHYLRLQPVGLSEESEQCHSLMDNSTDNKHVKSVVNTGFQRRSADRKPKRGRPGRHQMRAEVRFFRVYELDGSMYPRRSRVHAWPRVFAGVGGV